MATEKVQILAIEQVKTLADLKNNVRELKKELDTLEVGSEKYRETLQALDVNQNALKDAMYATSATAETTAGNMQNLTKAAQGADNTYNGLVHHMADLKKQMRSVDLSTAEGVAKFNQLSNEINGINTRLKDLDAQQGSYVRNVGNYTNSIKTAFKGMGDGVDAFGKASGIAVNGVKDGFEALSKTPLLAVVGLLVNVFMKLKDRMAENQTAMDSVNKAMKVFEPIGQMVNKIIEKLAGYLADAVEWFVQLAGKSGDTFSKIISGAVGVGNTLLKALLTPIKSVVEAFKGLGNVIKDVFTGNFKQIKEDATDALSGIATAFREGFDFKANFAAGREVGENFLNGLGSSKKKAREVGAGLAKDVKDGMAAAFDEELSEEDPLLDEFEKAGVKRVEADTKANEAIKAEREAYYKDLEAQQKKHADEEIKTAEEAAKEEAEIQQHKFDTFQGYMDATAALFSNLADLYENDTKNSKKNAEKVKALRIASATIDTISGAIGAYMSAVKSLGVPQGPIVGAIQAAAVTAAGLANIAKIKSTNVSGSSASSTGVSASVSAPAVQTSIPQTITATTASDQARLNESKPVKAYIVSSDLEANQTYRSTQKREASFG